MQWYYSDQGQRKGPIEESALEQLVTVGVVNDATLVWHEGMKNWESHASVRGPRTAPAVPQASATQTGYCGSCGRPFPVSEMVAIGPATICAACKPAYLQRMREGAGTLVGQRHYGGFWIRVVARLIDGVLLNVVFLLIRIPLRIPTFPNATPANSANLLASLGVYYVLTLGIAACYDIFFIARRGATVGKMLLGLKVVRADGSSVPTGLSTGRYFAYWVSALTIGIGYLMAGFDDQKRSLHDRICDTRVIYAK